jgi:hypothetical protein
MGLQGGRQNPIWQLSEPGNGCRSGKAQSPFETDTFFQQRLHQSGLTETELVGLLSGMDSGNVSCHVEPPDWTAQINQALAKPVNVTCSLFPQQHDYGPEIRFLELVAPFIEGARNKLRGRTARAWEKRTQPSR